MATGRTRQDMAVDYYHRMSRGVNAGNRYAGGWSHDVLPREGKPGAAGERGGIGISESDDDKRRAAW